MSKKPAFIPNNRNALITRSPTSLKTMSTAIVASRSEDFIVRGYAIKRPENWRVAEQVEPVIPKKPPMKYTKFTKTKKQPETKVVQPVITKSSTSIPAVPQNSEASFIEESYEYPVIKVIPKKTVLMPLKNYRPTREERDQKRLTKERDLEAAKANAKETFLRYSLPIQIGQWYNTACIHEQQVFAVENKYNKGHNFNHQKKLVLEYLHELTDLSPYSKTLKYEVPIQIQSSMEYLVSNSKDQISTHLVLSTIIPEEAILELKKPYVIESGSQVTLSHHLCRIRRNVFCFVKCPMEEKPEKSDVFHHENLYIRLFCRGSGKPLYLRCEIPKTETFGHPRDRFLVTVSETVDKYCQFQIQSLLEFKRRYLVHDVIPTFEKILLCHTMSRRFLSVDERLFNGSLIVGKEFKAICHNAKDSNNHLTSKNLWVIKTRKADEGN